jgi:hypothetical protein
MEIETVSLLKLLNLTPDQIKLLRRLKSQCTKDDVAEVLCGMAKGLSHSVALVIIGQL